MTNNGKLLASIGLAPVISDFLEDAGLKFEAKKRANRLINEIRAFDEFILKGATMESIEQQIDIQRAFRQWIEKNFGLPTTMVMEAVGIKSYNTYIKTFNDLVNFGFIILVEKSKNQYSANIIALSKFNKALNKALDKALIKHSTKQLPKQSESTIQSNDSIDKQYNKETINTELHSESAFNGFWNYYDKNPENEYPD